MNYIQKLRLLLDRDSKRSLLRLVFFSVFVSVVETIGIAAIMPFIDIATNFDNIHSNQYYQWIFDFFGFKSDVNFAIIFGLALIGFFIFRLGINLLYSYVMSYFSQNIYTQITKKLFETYLKMPYRVFTNKNSSYLTKAIITESTHVCGVISSALLMISEIFIIIFLYTLMLLASWKITIIFTIIMAFQAYLLKQTVSKKIKLVGTIRQKTQAKLYETINRLFGDFKSNKLRDKDRIDATNDDFFITVNEYSKANIVNNFLRGVPRLFLETTGFGLVVLVLVVFLYLDQSNVTYIIPILSLFVIALYRLLPSVNRIISGYNMFMYYHKSIDIIDEELRSPQEDLASDTIKFSYKIELKNIEFSYQEKPVLENITLTINKGEKIAFIGNSGSGKSTLVDLIIGLYQPNKGQIEIDDVFLDRTNLQSWRAQIGYIPQQVYLFDGTIKDNVCFGRKLDNDLLERVLKQANIFDFLETKQGLQTLVGEGGVQLSGGQRQRIAIARALYGEPEILILDEATSALDDETQQKIMDEIYQICNDKTLIVIAHRLSAVDRCNKTYKIEDGEIAKV